MPSCPTIEEDVITYMINNIALIINNFIRTLVQLIVICLVLELNTNNF